MLLYLVSKCGEFLAQNGGSSPIVIITYTDKQLCLELEAVHELNQCQAALIRLNILRQIVLQKQTIVQKTCQETTT